ncbi:MAG: ABC transporter permease [Meiothermus sp.]|nr:ABC transporter permease [Meiothermus sp.]
MVKTATPNQPPKSRSRSQIVWQQFLKHPLAIWGLRILALLYTIAIFAGFFSVYNPNFYETFPPTNNHPPSKVHWRDPETGSLSRPFVYSTRRTLDELTFQPKYIEDTTQKYFVRFFVRTPEQPYTILRVIRTDVRLLGVEKPGRLFLMGTDNFGRDLWSRIVYGSQVSLTIGILASMVSFILGLILGGVAGYYSGRPSTLSVPLARFAEYSGKQGSTKTSIFALASVVFWLAVIVGIAVLVVQFWSVSKGLTLTDLIIAALGAWSIYGIVRGHILQPIRFDLDDIIMRSVEIQSAIPGLFLLITLSAIIPQDARIQFLGTTVNFGDPLVKFYTIVFLLGFIGWGGLARIVRGTVLSVREQDYTVAAQSLGASDWRIISQHILPATSTYIIISLSLAIPGAILGESGLSFLGLGIREPYVSWGLLLQAAQEGGFASFVDRPWVLAPGFFIVVAVVAWNFLGDGLRDAFDPRKRQ